MLQPFKRQHSRKNSSNKPHSPSHSKAEAFNKYVTLDFQEDRMTFGRFRSHKIPYQLKDSYFKSFYSTKGQKWNKKYLSKGRKTGRQTSFTQRDTIIGTPYASAESNDQQILNPVLPALDRQRYKYLLKALSGISRTKRLPQFMLSSKNRQNNEDHIASSTSHEEEESGPKSPLGSPKVINLSVDFKERGYHPVKNDCENAYLRMFKNKRLLQRGRYSSTREQIEQKFSINILGEEEIRRSQIPRQISRFKRPVIVQD